MGGKPISTDAIGVVVLTKSEFLKYPCPHAWGFSVPVLKVNLWVVLFQVEPLKEELMDAGMTPRPSNELGDAGEPQAVLGRENPHGQTLNFSPAPQSDSLCAQHGGGEQPESRWATCSGGGPSPEERGSKKDEEHNRVDATI